MKEISKENRQGYIFQKIKIENDFERLTCGDGLIAGGVIMNCCGPIIVSLETASKQDEVYVKYLHEGDTFKNFKYLDFLRFCEVNKVDKWRITIKYKDNEVKICGDKENDEIELSYPETIVVDIELLEEEADRILYENNDFDKRALDILMTKYGKNIRGALEEVRVLLLDKDIYNEWLQIETTNKYADQSFAIAAEGYTIEKIVTEYRLSPFGACKCLKLLRTSPELGFDLLKDIQQSKKEN